MFIYNKKPNRLPEFGIKIFDITILVEFRICIYQGQDLTKENALDCPDYKGLGDLGHIHLKWKIIKGDKKC